MEKKVTPPNKKQPVKKSSQPFRPLFLPASLPPGYSDWRDWYSQNPNPKNQPIVVPEEETDLNLLLHRQAKKETGNFDPDVISGKRVSPKGAKGMAQAMPSAIKEYEKAIGRSVNITNPKESAAFQKYEMNRLISRPWASHPNNQSDTVAIAKALAAYNYGSTNTVEALNRAKAKGINIYSNDLKWLKELPLETSDYINKILLKKDPKFEEEYEKVKDVYRELYKEGGLIKRADGSYSKRGLWDNIRANRGSGKKPTPAMLKQERKIRRAEKKEDGGLIESYENGGWLDSYEDGSEVTSNPLMNLSESQRFPKQAEKTVVYPKGYIQNRINPNAPLIPLNFMGQPYATGAIEESMSPLDLVGGVRGGANLVKGALKYRQAMKPNYIQIGDELFNIGPHPRSVRRATKQMHKGVRDLVLPNAFEYGGSINDQRIPTPTSPSSYPDYTNPTLTNYQMGTPKSNLPIRGLRDATPDIPAYAYGGEIQSDSLYNMQRALQLGYKPDETGHWPSVDYTNGEWLKDKKHPTAWMEYLYGYTLNPELNRTTNVIQNEKGRLQYVPKKYAAGATVWTKQDTPTWAAGTPTPTATQNFKNTNSINTSRYRIRDVIPPGMDYKTPSAGTKDYSRVMTSYDWNNQRRLHAPDTTIMRDGGKITEDYKKRKGIPYAIHPGISNAEMYVGPTTQRGITFEDGGQINLNNGGWLDNL